MNDKRALLSFSLAIILVLTGLQGYQGFPGSSAQAASKTPVGSWTVTVTPDESPSFVDAVIFSSDGTMTVMEDTGQLGIGVWEKIRHNSYAFTFWEFYEDDGTFIQAKVNSTFQISHDGEHYSGPFTVEVRDLNGNLLFSGGGTATGVRLHVEPMQ